MITSEINFHFRARAVIISNNHILLAQRKGKQMTYLPGGHIEQGEQVEACLLREIEEELGFQARIISFLGGLESVYEDNGINHQEINLIFSVQINGVNDTNQIQSLESHLEFRWYPVAELDKFNLKPELLTGFIKDFCGGKQQPWWGSAGFEDRNT